MLFSRHLAFYFFFLNIGFQFWSLFYCTIIMAFSRLCTMQRQTMYTFESKQYTFTMLINNYFIITTWTKMCNRSHHSFTRSLILQELIIITTIYMMSGSHSFHFNFEFFHTLMLWYAAVAAAAAAASYNVWCGDFHFLISQIICLSIHLHLHYVISLIVLFIWLSIGACVRVSYCWIEWGNFTSICRNPCQSFIHKLHRQR